MDYYRVRMRKNPDGTRTLLSKELITDDEEE